MPLQKKKFHEIMMVRAGDEAETMARAAHVLV